MELKSLENQEASDGVKTPNQEQSWYLLSSSNPRYSEEQLVKENLRRKEAGITVFEYFVPYQFLQRRQPGDQPSTLTLHSEPSAESNQIRAALRRYVFIRTSESDLVAMLHSAWNLVEHRLQCFRTKQGQRVRISQGEMQVFQQACADERLKFEIWPAIDDVEENEEVMLLSTPFSGQRVRILKKHRTQNGIRLTVSVNIFSETLSVRLFNVKNEDVQYIGDSPKRKVSKESALVSKFQHDLLDILSRRVNRKETEASARADAKTLDNIYAFRSRPIVSEVLGRRFLAMMLICAHLRHDVRGCSELVSRVNAELEAINARSESRAATDVRAYLHVALYLATGQPQYRAAAKSYVREHNPKSDDLRRFVSLISKHGIR